METVIKIKPNPNPLSLRVSWMDHYTIGSISCGTYDEFGETPDDPLNGLAGFYCESIKRTNEAFNQVVFMQAVVRCWVNTFSSFKELKNSLEFADDPES